MGNSMSYKGYAASVTFDTDDKIIGGRAMATDAIISFHRESVAEFEANFHAAVEGYLVASAAPDLLPENQVPTPPGTFRTNFTHALRE
jgi:predicted HicB family RNase H-like nuclease